MKNFILFFLLSFFIEGVFGESLSVKEGDSVTLHTGLTEIQKDDVLEWRFGAQLIARVRKGCDPTTYDNVLGGRFRGRLRPDGQTGDLTITNITTEHTGDYDISTNPSRTFSVIAKTVKKLLSVKEGEPVTLETGVPHKQKVDQIMWKFRLYDSPIAQITEGTRKISHFAAGGRFIFKLKLDQNGSLTINKIKLNHIGYYALFITNGGETTMKLFNVEVLQNNPENVPLTSVQVP